MLISKNGGRLSPKGMAQELLGTAIAKSIAGCIDDATGKPTARELEEVTRHCTVIGNGILRRLKQPEVGSGAEAEATDDVDVDED